MAHQQQKWPKEKKEKLAAYARAALAERFATSRGHVYRILKEMGA